MKYARVGVYTLQGNVRDVAREAREGLLPILRRQAGFVDFDLVAADDTLISISTWQTQQQAADGSLRAARFVLEHLSAELTLEANYVGDVPVSSRT